MNKWLEKYSNGDIVQQNYNDVSVSLPEGFVGMGYNTKGRNYSPAWGGQFAMGGSLPGAVGFTYARTNNPAPSNGKYAKKTMPSAQDGWVTKAANAEFSCAANPRSNLNQSYSEYCNPKKGLDKDEYKALKNELSSSSMKDLLNVEEYYVLKNLADNQNRKMGREDNAYSKYFDQSTGLPIPNLTNELKEEGNLRATNRMYPGRKNLLVNDVYQGVLKDYNITTPQTPAQTKSLLEKAYNIGYAIPKQQDGGMTYYQNGLDWKPKSMEEGGLLNQYQGGGEEPLTKSSADWYKQWYEQRQALPQFNRVAGERLNLLSTLPKVQLTPLEELQKFGAVGEYIKNRGGDASQDIISLADPATVPAYAEKIGKSIDVNVGTDPSVVGHEMSHWFDARAKQYMFKPRNSKSEPYEIYPAINPSKFKKAGLDFKTYNWISGDDNPEVATGVKTELNSVLNELRQKEGFRGDQSTTPEQLQKIIDKYMNLSEDDLRKSSPKGNQNQRIRTLIKYMGEDAKKLSELNNRIVAIEKEDVPIAKHGGWLNKYEVPKNQNAEYKLPSITKPREASESTANTFYNPITKKIVNTATTGQTKENLEASTRAMGKTRKRDIEEEKQRVAERKAAVATKDKGKPFTLPTGETKKFEDMTTREQFYVSGKALENRGRFNENEESILDDINPLNWLGSMAGALGTAPYIAKQTDSNLPYVGAVIDPLIQGALGFNPLGSAINTGKKIGSKVAQSMESGMLSNAHKINPYAFKPNPEVYYRGIGKQGTEDALKTGVFRQAGVESGTPNFKKVWYAKGNKGFERASAFSDGYVAEVPKTSFSDLDFLKNSMGVETRATSKHIPISEGNILKKDWLQGWKKEVPKPTSSISSSVENVGNDVMDFNKDFGVAPMEYFSEYDKGLVASKKFMDKSQDVFENLKSKHKEEFEKLYGTDYNEKDLLNYAKIKEQYFHPSETPLSSEKFSRLNNEFIEKFNPADIESINEKNALQAYTSGSYRGFNFRPNTDPNKTVLSLSGEHNPIFYKDEMSPSLQSAILKNKLNQHLALYRGIGDESVIPKVWRNNELLENIKFKDLIEGDEMLHEPFVSTSLFPNPQFGGFSSGTARIVAPKGQSYAFANKQGLSYTPSELELTLPQNLRFKITKKHSADEAFKLGYGVEQEIVNPYKEGGVIKDNMGYWNPENHGKVVEIDSPYITMEGVDQPLIGISDEGDQKYMLPGKNYKFKGKKVREYPVAKNGVRQEQKGLQNLDDLLNFTNYNKPQPGGWLNKYN